MLSADEASQLAANEALFDLPGDTSTSLWVRTCEDPQCQCRSALVVATDAGRDVLLKQAAIVRAAWNAQVTDSSVASRLDRAHHFFLDIDSAKVFWSWRNGEDVDVSDHRHIGPIARRIDGELLDEIARLWYSGKGRPNPEQQVLKVEKVSIAGWRPGRLVAWSDLMVGLRQDIYDLGHHVYEAHEMYCVSPDCRCGEVVIDFEALTPRGAPDPGHVVVVAPSGEARAMPRKRAEDRLAELWAAFRHRHPSHMARFARRYAVVRMLGARIAQPASVAKQLVSKPQIKSQPQIKVGRNDPCSCGSGRKYKKCCGAVSP
jgi:hypothetical protein